MEEVNVCACTPHMTLGINARVLKHGNRVCENFFFVRLNFVVKFWYINNKNIIKTNSYEKRSKTVDFSLSL